MFHTDIITIIAYASPQEWHFFFQVTDTPLLRLLLTSEQFFVQNVLLLLVLVLLQLPQKLSLFDPPVSQRIQLGKNSSAQPTGMNGCDFPKHEVSSYFYPFFKAEASDALESRVEFDQDLFSEFGHMGASTYHQDASCKLLPNVAVADAQQTGKHHLLQRLVNERVAYGITN